MLFVSPKTQQVAGSDLRIVVGYGPPAVQMMDWTPSSIGTAVRMGSRQT